MDSTIQISLLDDYLREAYIPALHRAGIEKVGVFKTIEGKNDGQNLVVVFIPFVSLTQFEELPSLLEADQAYLDEGKVYREAAYNMPPFLRMESTLMKAFSSAPFYHTPNLKTKKSERVYELRNYQSATETLHKRKVEMFNSGETDLFTELGFEALFYAEVISGSKMPNLMYMTCHANAEAQEANWAAFRIAPVWTELKAMEKFQNTVSHIDKWMLYPVEYSEL